MKIEREKKRRTFFVVGFDFFPIYIELIVALECFIILAYIFGHIFTVRHLHLSYCHRKIADTVNITGRIHPSFQSGHRFPNKLIL